MFWDHKLAKRFQQDENMLIGYVGEDIWVHHTSITILLCSCYVESEDFQ